MRDRRHDRRVGNDPFNSTSGCDTSAPMKLADWLFDNSVSPGAMRSRLGVSRTAIHRYLTHKRIPQPRMLQRIITLTGGQVQLADFLDPEPPRCVRVEMKKDGSTRWVLPWSEDYDTDEPRSERLSPPLTRALAALDGRAWFTPSGTFLLDGRVSDPKRLVMAANAALLAQGKPPIAYPGVQLPRGEQ